MCGVHPNGALSAHPACLKIVLWMIMLPLALFAGAELNGVIFILQNSDTSFFLQEQDVRCASKDESAQMNMTPLSYQSFGGTIYL
jgi:hypothetical protein